VFGHGFICCDANKIGLNIYIFFYGHNNSMLHSVSNAKARINSGIVLFCQKIVFADLSSENEKLLKGFRIAVDSGFYSEKHNTFPSDPFIFESLFGPWNFMIVSIAMYLTN